MTSISSDAISSDVMSSDSMPSDSPPPHANGATAIVDDRRSQQRIPAKLTTSLVGLHCDKTIECTVCDVSESGLFLHAAASSGIRVGQRFEVSVDGGAPLVGLASSLRDGCYATVVRTAQGSSVPQHMLGAGLRFDQPLLC